MTVDYSYSTKFILTKAYLTECYEQSVIEDLSIMKYKRAIISLVFGACLLAFNLASDYLAFFVIALGVLEVFSTRYRKTWWLWRQMLGKSYKSEVTILVSEEGINNQSSYVNDTIKWADVTTIDKTDLGLLVRHLKGTSYLSKSCLDDDATEYILSHIKVQKAK